MNAPSPSTESPVWPLINVCAKEVQHHFLAYLRTGLLRCVWNISGWMLFLGGIAFVAFNGFSERAMMLNTIRASITWPVLLVGSVLLGLGERRVIARHLAGAHTLGARAVWTASKERWEQGLLLAVLLIVLHVAALACCVFPVIPMSIALHLAMPIFVVDNVSAWQAIRRSFEHAKNAPLWAIRAWALDMIASLAAGTLPILGWLLQTPVAALIDLLELRGAKPTISKTP